MSEGLFGSQDTLVLWFYTLLLFMSLMSMQVTKFPIKQYSIKFKWPYNNTSSFPYSKLEITSFALNI